MESVTFLKFWKPTEEEKQVEEEEEEDSFFDLELLSVSPLENKNPDKNSMENKKKVGFKEEEEEEKANLDLLQRQRQTQTDFISKRKILPIEPNSKPPQSPIQLLKSAQKIPVLIFKRQKSMENKNTKEEGRENRGLGSKLSRENNVGKKGSILRKQNETVLKYLKLIKPLYEKVLKKYTDADPMNLSSPADSPLRSVCKHLGKSKSASSSTSVSVSTSLRMRDDSLWLQHDGIQGAILHCKRSLNASTEHSLLSRSENVLSQERPRSLSCKGFSIQEIKEEGV